MLYFTSDLHFYHDNIIQLTSRPYQDVNEMNDRLIANWNKKIRPKDEVYILGDVTMKSYVYAQEALQQLQGRKYLIRGNHDRFVQQKEFDQSLFSWVKEYAELKYEGYRFILFHYPIAEWNGFYHGAIHLHGHQHNPAQVNDHNRDNGFRRYDVGVDANQQMPVSIVDIINFFEAEPKIMHK